MESRDREPEKGAFSRDPSRRDLVGGLLPLHRDLSDGWTLPLGQESQVDRSRRLSNELREKEAACVTATRGLAAHEWRRNAQSDWQKNLETLNELEQRLAAVHGRPAAHFQTI